MAPRPPAKLEIPLQDGNEQVREATTSSICQIIDLVQNVQISNSWKHAPNGYSFVPKGDVYVTRHW